MKDIKTLPVVILAGGQAKRMRGKDKALIDLQQRPLLSHVLEKISGYAAPIGLNVNKNKEKYLGFNYPILNDKIEGFLGPLSGQQIHLDFENPPDHDEFDVEEESS